MLQSPLSKVYGHGHIKKFWLMRNQKESESKAVTASSSAPPPRQVSSSAGLGHESKQGPQISLGNAMSRSLPSLSGVSVRHIVSGPACSNMGMTGHARLVTCAKSLNPPLRTDQSRSGLRPTSPSSSAGERISVGESHNLTSRCSPESDGSSEPSHKLSRDFSYSFSLISKDILDSGAYDHLFLSKNQHQDEVHLQERFDHVSASDDSIGEVPGVELCKYNMGILSNSDSSSPFAVPFQLPKKLFLEAEAKPYDEEPASEVSDGSPLKGKGVPGSVSLGLECGPAKLEWNERICVSTAEEASKDEYAVSGGGLRMCSLCGTTKTPLWRGGPQGPKSLCNACGIRFKKSKRVSTGEGTPSPKPQFVKSSLKPATKRKQDNTPVSSDAHSARPLAMGAPAPISGLATQVAKKRRWSKLIKKGELASSQRCDAAIGSCGESGLTWNVGSPSAVSSPSVAQFERLSIDENARVPEDNIAGKDEEEAAVLLMYMSCGRVFT